MIRLLKSGLLASTAMIASAAPALAQTPVASSPQPAPTENAGSNTATTEPTKGGAQDIIVTAQRRNESLSKTPVSVAIVSGDTLAKAQVTSEQDLRIATPGLSVRATTGSNQLNYSLRGQSQDAFSGTRPGVLPYINEVQIGGSGGSTAFYDLQSVQVLKGPQGTLFGRSATGGAVLFTTVKPTDTFGGYVSGLYGNYKAVKVEGAVNAPLAGDRLKARIAGFYQRRDGFQRNLYDGGREGDLKRWGLRGSLSADVGVVKNDLVVDYFNSRSENTIGVLSGLLPFTGGGATNPPYIPIQFLYAGTATPLARATGIGTVQAFTGAPAAAAAAYYDAYFASSLHPNTGITGVLADQQARGPFVVNSDGKNIYNADNIVLTNATSIELGSDTRLKNIFGYTHLKSLSAFDADGTPYNISSQGPKNSPYSFRALTKQVSEELQIGGTGLDRKLNYVAGVYFSNESTRTLEQSAFFDLLFGGANQNNFYTIKNKTYAVYAQGTYKLNDRGLAATLGVRYTSEKVGKLVLPGDSIRAALGDPAPAGYSYDQARKFNRLSWQIGLQDQVDPHLLIYVVSRRAYKSGGFNGLVAPLVGFAGTSGDSFLAERVTDAEVGAKYQGVIGLMPTRFAIAVFHNWIDNSQRTAYSVVQSNPASLTVNVPKGRTYGLELEGQVKPSRWLALGGTFNYTHARYINGVVNANGSVQAYDQVPDTPKISGTAYADVTVPVSGDISVVAHGDVYGQEKSFTTPRSVNSFGTTISGYMLANFRLGLQDDRAGWSLTGNLKNAFNRVYYAGGIPTGEIYQINLLVPGEPRTFTVEARLKF